MPHFSTIKIQIKDAECLIESLLAMGFEPQVYSSPVHLYGYRGDLRNQKAHIVVNRQQIHHSSNDLGFYWNGTEYECIISDFDMSFGNAQPGQGLGKSFLPSLFKQYGNILVKKKALELQEKFGECTITETQTGTLRTMRLVFAAHQQIQHIRR